jgi:hypothetical protein
MIRFLPVVFILSLLVDQGAVFPNPPRLLASPLARLRSSF